VDIKKFSPPSGHEKTNLRTMNGYDVRDFIILYIAEFTFRKNHELILNRVEQLNDKIENLKIIFAGDGPLLNKYKNKIKRSNLSSVIDFSGYRNDVDVLCKMADISLSPSKQEGLPIGIVEGFASGLPVVCSKIRGHTDVIKDEHNGFLFELNNPQHMVDSIVRLYNDPGLRSKMAQNNIQDAKKYSGDIAVSKMAEIYTKWM
ncbi:MAG: glycosyltransferase family 4 protein, partial [Treponema sp.]|nr:glycosyltransferase family 4 protein [Treponema sp.]